MAPNGMPSDAERQLAETSLRMASVVDAALSRIESEQGVAADSRVKYLGPLIEEQRAAIAPLEAQGVSSFADFQEALRKAEEAKSHKVLEAAAKLRGAEDRWREVLNGLESAANQFTSPALKLGDIGPVLKLQSGQGREVSLEDILAEGPSGVLTVWLRHFG